MSLIVKMRVSVHSKGEEVQERAVFTAPGFVYKRRVNKHRKD